MVNKIQHALDYINSNYTDDITLSETAVQAELRISQFSKLFKHMCGMSFVTYLNYVRVSKAEEMIINTMVPITDIALECGFNSIRNFNRTFKKLKGTTPSDLRKLTASSKTSIFGH
jgi:AraC-like DNA-binding protein